MGDKENKHKAFKLLILVFIGIILFFSKKENQNKFIKFISVSNVENKGLRLTNSIPIDIDGGEIALYNDHIIVWKDNRLSRFKLNGDIVWEKEFNLDETRVHFGKDEIYIYERPTGQIYILGPEGETREKFQLNMEIYNLVEGPRSLLIHTKEEGIENINILDEEANLIGQKSIEGQKILAYCMDRNHQYLALSTLYFKGENLRTEIQVFGMEGEFLWTVYLENEIVMYLNFHDGNNLIALTDRGVYHIDDGNILWKKQFQLIKDIYMDGEKIYILHENILEAFELDGRTLSENSFSEGYKKIVFKQDYIILYGDDHIVGLKEGMEVFNYNSERTIVKVLCGKGKLILVCEGSIDIISL